MGGRAKTWVPKEMPVVFLLTKFCAQAGGTHKTGPRVGRSTGIHRDWAMEGTVVMIGRAHEVAGTTNASAGLPETTKVTAPIRRRVMPKQSPNSEAKMGDCLGEAGTEIEVLKELLLVGRPRCRFQLQG